MKNLQNLGNLYSLGNVSQGGAIQYLLKDTFSQTLAAGSVNNTQADIGGARTVTDTNSKISLANGLLNFATGEVANNGIWYPTIKRVAGKVLIGEINHTSGNNSSFGWDNNSSGLITESIQISGAGTLTYIRNSSGIVVGSITLGTTYKLALILAATGTYAFIKGGTEYPKYSLIFISDTNSSDMLPAVSSNNTTAVFTADNIRVPQNLFIPSPLSYDTFTRSNGALGSTESSGPDSQGTPILVWTGSTWTIVSNVALNTPATLGSELTTDGALENWTNATTPTSWTPLITGTSTVNKETSVVHGGSAALRLDIDGTNDSANISQNITTVLDGWYLASYWAKASTTGKSMRFDFNGLAGRPITPTTAYVQYFASRKTIGVSTTITTGRNSAASSSLYVDDISVKQLTLSELIASISTSTKDVIADVNITIPTDALEGGVVVNLDSAVNPQNFVLGTLSFNSTGGVATLYKCVAGVYTSVISAAVTYAAGATLRVIKDGTSYQLFYNNAKVGSTSTVSDAGIISNTLHGLFSTYSSVSLDNFLVMPRGSTANEYASLDSY